MSAASESMASTTEWPDEMDDFAPVPDYKIWTFMALFAVSFFFTILLFLFNLFKSYRMYDKKNLFRQASCSMKREPILRDKKMRIGVPLGQTNAHKAR